MNCDRSKTLHCEKESDCCLCLCISPSDVDGSQNKPVCVGECHKRHKSPHHEVPKFIDRSEITICEKRVPLDKSDFPHFIFPRQKCCDPGLEAKAPLIVNPGSAQSFTFTNLTIAPAAGAVDTNCKGELAYITVAPFSSFPEQTNYGSNIFYLPLSGPITITANGVPRVIEKNQFILIKAGTPSGIVNPLPDPVLVFAGWLGPGGLGRFNESAQYQTAVGGEANLDPSIVESIAKKYCVYKKGAEPEPFIPAGTVVFKPLHTKRCKEGTWGLSECQLMVLSTTLDEEEVRQGQRAKVSATVAPHTRHAEISVPTLVPKDIVLSGSIIRDPRCGTAEVVASPTINNEATATITTGFEYEVFYDVASNNITIQPVRRY